MMLGAPIWSWGAFLLIVLAVLAFDLGVLNRGDHVLTFRKSLYLSLSYIALACLFGAWVFVEGGHEDGMDFYTGYLIEKSLSIDNIFVMSVIFAYFKIPLQYQHRVLFWGILGVLLMRGVMILLGTLIIARFEWILLIFGAFLVYTGAKMLIVSEEDHITMDDSRIVRFLEKHVRFTHDIHGRLFRIRLPDPRTGRMAWFATPLLLALITIELADIIFAVDSIPAVFAITTNTFVVYTSNIFACLGLRALYFLLAALVHRFRFLTPAVSLVLVFIGGKVFYSHFIGPVGAVFSLAVTLCLLAGGLLLSLALPKKEGLS
jgi:tellurite resistance protein TerC